MVALNTENYWILSNSYKLQAKSYKLPEASDGYFTTNLYFIIYLSKIKIEER